MGIKPSATVFLSWFRSEQPVRRPRRWNGDFDALEGRQLLSADGMHGHLAMSPGHAEVSRLHDDGGGNHHRQLRSFVQTNLVSDQPGVATIQDTDLVNAWGIAHSPTSAFWVSANGTGVADLYKVDSNNVPTKLNLEVTIPGDGSVTGQVFNNTSAFNGDAFLFVSEDGTISGWRPALGTKAETLKTASDANVYKGVALATINGNTYLYAANFRNGTIDVLKGNSGAPDLTGNFKDRKIPNGYAPFNIQLLEGKLYVTYGKQDDKKHDDVAGQGHGFVDVFDTNGTLLKRLVRHGQLDSPWGLAIAPSSFGKFAGDLLVGNFGNGHINAYNPNTGTFLGSLRDASNHNRPLTIDGLWGLIPGNDGSAGNSNTIYFSAGPGGESHGLFGSLTVPQM